MKLQPAIEFLSVYTWTILGVIIFVAIIIALSIGLGKTTYPPSTCYISPTLQCTKMYITLGQPSPVAYLFFTNELGRTIGFSVNSFSIRPTYLNNTYYGTCSPTTALNGNFVECTAILTGYSASLGTQLNPTFSISYDICGSICAGSITVYNTSGSATLTVSPQVPTAFIPPAQILIPVYYSNQVDVVVGNTVTNTISVDSDPDTVAYVPYSDYAYVTTDTGKVDIINLTTDKKVGSITTNTGECNFLNNPSCDVLTPDGKYLYAIGVSHSGTLVKISTATNTVVNTITGLGPASSSTFAQGVWMAPDGKYVYVMAAGDDDYGCGKNQPTNIYQISVSSNAVDKIALSESYVCDGTQLAITPNGKSVYVDTFESYPYGVADIQTADNPTSVNYLNIEPNANSHGEAISPDGKYLWVVGDGGYATIFYTSDDVMAANVPISGLYAQSVAITPDGTKAIVEATVGTSQQFTTIYTGNYVVANVLYVSPASDEESEDIQVSPDGKTAYAVLINSASSAGYLVEINTSTYAYNSVKLGYWPENFTIIP